jgi:uncharacterized protein (DUF1501 family)
MFSPSGAGERVLVLVNLNGGNDGLNTVVPFDDPIYQNARRTIALPKGSTLPLTDTLGLNGTMTGFRSLYDQGDLAIVQSVGYPNHDRSHFRSTDIWNTASNAEDVLFTGWLGRYLEGKHPEYPSTLPSAPFAVQISSSVSLALASDKGNMGIAIDNPDRFYNLANGLSVEDEPLPQTLAGPELAYIRDIIGQSNAFSTSINKAMLDGTTNVQYDADTFSSQLKVVARLINGGLTTGIYVVTLSGFDTHNAQVGRHAQLLGQLSRGISSFLADVAAAGNADRVACMTYSEFGRRLNENGSSGSDHGSAAPQFVIGAPVLGGKVIGGNPNLSDLDSRGDIKHVTDFRQIYTTVLEDWLGMTRPDAVGSLGGEFEKLSLFTVPTVFAPENAARAGYSLAPIAPNPVSDGTAVRFTIPDRARVAIRVVDTRGATLITPGERMVDAGSHSLWLATSGLPSGRYTVVLDAGRFTLSQPLVVAR